MTPVAALADALEAALAADDGAAVHGLLQANPPLWKARTGHTADWDRYAALLLRLVGKDLSGTGPALRHAVCNLLTIQEHDSQDAACRRLAQVLPAVDRWIAKDEHELLRFVDEVRGPYPRCGAVASWLGHIRRRELHPHVSPDVAEAAQLAHDCSRRWEDVGDPDWSLVWPGLVARLAGPNGQVRFYAAHLLGEWYADNPSLQPPLKQVFERITALDLARPGVAGPFLGAFYSGMDLPTLQDATGVDLHDWVLHLLEHRRGPEPWTLPCCNGIDFYAHEMLGTEEDLVRLVRAGHIEIAAESAGDYGVDFRAVLRGMACEPLPTARDIVAHLLVHHGELPPSAEAASAVQRLPPLDGAQRLLLPPTARDPDARTLLVVLPAPGQEAISDAVAWAALDAAMPPALRGTATADKRTPWQGGAKMVTFPNATLHLVGPSGDAGWKRAVLACDIPAALWAT